MSKSSAFLQHNQHKYSGFNCAIQVSKAPLPAGLIGDELMGDVSNIEHKDGIREIESFAKAGEVVYIDRSFLAGEMSRDSGGDKMRLNLATNPRLFL